MYINNDITMESHHPELAEVANQYGNDHLEFPFRAGKDSFMAGAKWAFENVWFDITKLIPPIKAVVLVHGHNMIPTVAFHIRDGRFLLDGSTADIEFWMPIPALPAKEEGPDKGIKELYEEDGAEEPNLRRQIEAIYGKEAFQLGYADNQK